MPPTLQQKPQGNADAVPQTDEKIEFTTPEEMEKYEHLIDQKYVKVDATGNPDKKHKSFYYQIVSMHPSQPAGFLGEQFVIEFGIQKFDKTKVHIEEKNGSKIRVSEMVRAWDDAGRCVDAGANFFISAKDFLKQYQRDTE